MRKSKTAAGFVTTTHAAKLQGITRQGVTKQIRENRLYAMRVSKRLYLIPIDSLQEFLKRSQA